MRILSIAKDVVNPTALVVIATDAPEPLIVILLPASDTCNVSNFVYNNKLYILR